MIRGGALPQIVALSLILWGTACGGGGIRCERPDQLLVGGEDPLTCEQAVQVADYIHVLAARNVDSTARNQLNGWLRKEYRADPDATNAWLERLAQDGRQLEVLHGIEGAKKRSKQVYQALQGEGLIGTDQEPAFSVQTAALAAWGTDDEAEMALTEADIEGWIRYASLCRQVQGGATVALSVSDRVQVYRMMQDRFTAGDVDVKTALTAIGPYWSQIHQSWEGGSYERQQAWMGAAPLPPPMTSTSLGYIEALLQGDVAAHARVLHERLGPFTMVKGRRAFPD